MRILEIPCDSLKPMCSQVSPPSWLRYTPSPGRMLPRMQVSPVPMKTRSGSVSLTATAPIDAVVIWKSVTGCQSSPPSVVFQRPPPGGAEVGLLGPPLDTADRDGAAAAVGTEVAPGVANQEGGVESDGLGLSVKRGRRRGQTHHVHAHSVREGRDPLGERCAGQGRSDCGECRDEQERHEWEALHGCFSCGFGSWYGPGQATVAMEGATSRPTDVSAFKEYRIWLQYSEVSTGVGRPSDLVGRGVFEAQA